MTPGARLVPHEGRPNQMVFQLGLQCPRNLWLRVGNTTKDYREGGMVIFEGIASILQMEDYFSNHVAAKAKQAAACHARLGGGL